jgi:thiazole synthase
LEDVGCATVMPLASPIGSGQGLKMLPIFRSSLKMLGCRWLWMLVLGHSEAAQAMELGADALLINSAIALAKILLLWLVL